MLILSRKVGESFLIGDGIEIKVTEISGDRVKIGIEAPKDCTIIRKELQQTVESNHRAAAAPQSRETLGRLFQTIAAKQYGAPPPGGASESPVRAPGASHSMEAMLKKAGRVHGDKEEG